MASPQHQPASEAPSSAAPVEKLAACLFRYVREYAVLVRRHSNCACTDNKLLSVYITSC